MTLNAFLCVFATVLFALCGLLFLSQALYALDFRKKIALRCNFSEAVMVGPYYPLLIVSFCLIFIQFVSFFAAGFTTEFNIAIRIFTYLTSIVLFLYFRSKTPPLLAYWLSPYYLWRKEGITGRIPYSDIIGIQLSKDVVFPITDPKRLCRVTFQMNPDYRPCSKITCLITARDLEELSKKIDVFPYNYRLSTVSMAKKLSVRLLPLLMFVVFVMSFLIAASSGMFCPHRYTNGVVTEEVKTLTSVTEVGVCGDNVCVYYENVGVINVYGTDGAFRYAISCPTDVLKPQDFSVTDDGLINYRLAGMLYRYSLTDGSLVSEAPLDENGKSLLQIKSDLARFDYSSVYFTDEGGERIIVSRPNAVAIFNIEIIWSILAVLIAVSFTMRFLNLRKKTRISG